MVKIDIRLRKLLFVFRVRENLICFCTNEKMHGKYNPFAFKVNPWATLHAHSPWYCLLTRDRSSPGGPRSEVSIVWDTLAPRSIWIQITSSQHHTAQGQWSLTRSRRRPPGCLHTSTVSLTQEAESSLRPETRGEEELTSAGLQIKNNNE